MRGLRWMILGATLVTGTAFAQQGQMQQGQMQQGQKPEIVVLPETLEPSEFLAELMLVNSWAIEISQIAQRQAATPAVRQFAQKSVKEHQRFQQELQKLAQLEGIDVVSAMEKAKGAKQDFMHAAMLTTLAGLPTMNGVNLDRAYLSSIVLSHDLAINKVQWALTKVDVPRLNKAAQDELNGLAQHREQAYRLLGKVAPEVKRGQARRGPPAERR